MSSALRAVRASLVGVDVGFARPGCSAIFLPPLRLGLTERSSGVAIEYILRSNGWWHCLRQGRVDNAIPIERSSTPCVHEPSGSKPSVRNEGRQSARSGAWVERAASVYSSPGNFLLKLPVVPATIYEKEVDAFHAANRVRNGQRGIAGNQHLHLPACTVLYVLV